MNADPLDSVTLDVAAGVIDHLDTMYPAALQAAPSSARISLRNTIRAKVRQAVLEDRQQQAGQVLQRRKLPLTRRQAQTLDFIRQYVTENACAPSYEEIGAGIGLRSKSGVMRLVNGLKERGHVRHEPGMARTLEVLG